MSETPNGFALYDVEGASRPLLLSETHAEEIGATLHAATVVKASTIADVLADVGEDKDKAAVALEAEQSRGDDARSSLVSKLQAIIEA